VGCDDGACGFLSAVVVQNAFNKNAGRGVSRKGSNLFFSLHFVFSALGGPSVVCGIL
jgi:hypothetical protein